MIRKMLISDVDAVYEIENEAFFEPWTKRGLIKDLEDNSFLEHFVYEKDGKVVGFYIISKITDLVEIFTIAVKKEYRSQKIGSTLLEEIIKFSKENDVTEIWLEVSTRNTTAISLYQKYGFEIQKIRKNYYRSGEDAYNMIRKL